MKVKSKEDLLRLFEEEGWVRVEDGYENFNVEDLPDFFHDKMFTYCGTSPYSDKRNSGLPWLWRPEWLEEL